MSETANLPVQLKLNKSIALPSPNTAEGSTPYEPNSLYMVKNEDDEGFELYCSTKDGLELIKYKEQRSRSFAEEHLRRELVTSLRWMP